VISKKKKVFTYGNLGPPSRLPFIDFGKEKTFTATWDPLQDNCIAILKEKIRFLL